MDMLHTFLNLILHLDQSITLLVGMTGPWIYLVLFLVFFCETGIIVMAFLPGDSLLFAIGAFAAYAPDTLNIHVLFILLLTASVLGNGVNYLTGKWIGPQIFRRQSSWLFNPAHLERAHRFYERYGSKAIVIARFMPVIRTFAPFVAGIGTMAYRRFFLFNLFGALIWIGGLLYGSYLFGNIPIIRDHFSGVVLGIITLSLLPAAMGVARHLFQYAK